MDLIPHIKDFIKKNNIVVLATVLQDQPHACTVYYVTPDSTKLYFKSLVISDHSKFILQNPKVAAVIYSKDSSPSSEKQGIQILGTVYRVLDPTEMETAAELYISTFNSPRDKFFPLEDFVGPNANAGIYCINIEKVKMMDSANGIKPDAYIAL